MTKKKKLTKERYKQRTHKLTKRLVEFIRQQEGKLSYRQICAAVRKKTSNRCKIHPSTVHYILKNQIHKIESEDPNKIFIYDLIEKAQTDESLNVDELTTDDTRYQQ